MLRGMNILQSDAHLGILSKHELMLCHGEIFVSERCSDDDRFFRVISQARNGTLALAFLPEILYELNFNNKI